MHLDIVVDIVSAVDRAIAAGATPGGSGASQCVGKARADGRSFGHGFCLIEFIGRGYDEIATR